MQTVWLTAASIGGIAFAAGVMLYVASRVFAVRENPLVDEVESLLPGANCGGCGFAGCRAFAEALVSSRDTGLRCPVATQEAMATIGEKLGMTVQSGPRLVARVFCAGGSRANREGVYEGISSCLAVQVSGLSTLQCETGCLGLGDCVTACPFGAIEVADGVARVNDDACTGCGLCVEACPKDLIRLTPGHAVVYVACRSVAAGAVARKACRAACIGCKRCVKACSVDAIAYEPFLATIDPDRCTACGACVSQCPTGAIVHLVGEVQAVSEVMS